MNQQDQANLRKLAEEWIERECGTDDLRFEGGSTSINKLMRAYVEAANPATIIELLDTIKQQRELLERARNCIDALPGYPKGADLCDEIDKHLQQQEGVWNDNTNFERSGRDGAD